MNTEEKIFELLWDYLKRDPEHHDRKQTGYGTKTKQGLAACIYRITKEHFGNETIATSLKARFPWLGTDEEANGADVVQSLADWYESLTTEPGR